ncbi:MAG: cobalamin B12-binding domain-containing protein [Deltaproteobacteria bacterium]|nr:cobalamin B12-binding domain-containing protein [Deltaproteobacteria bacterium]
MAADPKNLKPYGDHLGDGGVQVSFTLPVPPSDAAKEAARLYAEKMGLEKVQVTCMEGIGPEFTFFVVYGFSKLTINFDKIIVPKMEIPRLTHKEIEEVAHQKLGCSTPGCSTQGRRIVVIGGTTGSDAHTVGIDAILSMKGLAGDKGLESYSCFEVHNLRAQVDNKVLVEQAMKLKAEAILVSQLVTQQDQHIKNLKEMLKLLKEVKNRALLVVGGPRMTHKIAHEIGFDAGFGPGTKPSEVASFIVHELIRRQKDGQEKSKSRLEGKGPGASSKKGRSLFGWLGGGGEDS